MVFPKYWFPAWFEKTFPLPHRMSLLPGVKSSGSMIRLLLLVFLVLIFRSMLFVVLVTIIVFLVLAVHILFSFDDSSIVLFGQIFSGCAFGYHLFNL